jgi:hypothetical protein
MKNLYMILFLVASLGCIKKKIEDQQQSLLMQAITTGQWKITNFNRGGSDATASFSSYTFQFKNDYTVDAINNGIVEKTGSWTAAGNVQAQTITANFQNATDPLVLLNGTWNILNTSWTAVEASQTVSGELRALRMDRL